MNTGFAMTLAALAAAHGATLVNEGFDSTPGSDVLTPLNGGDGCSGAWARAQQGANDSITVVTGVPTNNSGVPGTGNGFPSSRQKLNPPH